MLPGLSAKPPKVMSHALTSWEINADSSSLVPGPWRLGRDKALGKAPTLPTGEVEVCETKLEEKALWVAKIMQPSTRQTLKKLTAPHMRAGRAWAWEDPCQAFELLPWALSSEAEVLLPYPVSRLHWEALRAQNGLVFGGLKTGRQGPKRAW